MNLSPELLAKAKAAKTAEELIALAAENGVTLTAEEAEMYFAQLHKKAESLAEAALADEELENVAGGSQCKNGRTYSSDPPYYLITTALNKCKGYNFIEGCSHGWSKDGYCRSCYWRDGGDMFYETMYCHNRTKDNDHYK